MGKAKYKVTHILLFDREDKFDPQSIWVFRVKHLLQVDPKAAIVAAFKEWSTTKDGLSYIEENGVNWGDSMSIPHPFLKQVGIVDYEILDFENPLVVDHNEQLIDQPKEIEIEIET